MAKGESTTIKKANQRKAYRRRKARGQARAARAQEAEAARVAGLRVTQPHAAGIDIGSRSHWSASVAAATVATTSCRSSRPTLTAFTKSWPICGNTASQPSPWNPAGSTGSPLYELLEANGFEVLLVDPSYTKQVEGRPKTDRLDCQWIYRSHSVGLLAQRGQPGSPWTIVAVPSRQPSGPSILRNRQTQCGKSGRHCNNCRRRMAWARGSSYKGREGHETGGNHAAR
jgi:hypothetical protein